MCQHDFRYLKHLLQLRISPIDLSNLLLIATLDILDPIDRSAERCTIRQHFPNLWFSRGREHRHHTITLGLLLCAVVVRGTALDAESPA